MAAAAVAVDKLDQISSTPELGVPFFDKAHGMAAGEVLGMAAPSSPDKAGQIAIDIPAKAVAGADADAPGDRGSNLGSDVVGIVAASTAVTMLAAGAVSPPLAFGFYVLLLGGLLCGSQQQQ